MEELTLSNKKYISSKRAAEITGYAKDYVGQLCREGYVEAARVGRSWYVSEDSIREHRFGKEREIEEGRITLVEKSDVEHDTPFIMAETSKTSIGAPVSTYSTEEVTPLNLLEKERYEVVHDPLPERVETQTPPIEIYEQEPVTNTESEVAPVQVLLDGPVVTDTQKAWQEWFSLQQARNNMDQKRLDVPHVYEELDSGAVDPQHLIINASPVAPKQIDNSVSYIPESTVALATEAYGQEEKVPIQAIEYDFQIPKSYSSSGSVSSFERPVRESSILRLSPVVSRAILLSIATLFATVAVLGSGLADAYLNTSIFGKSEIINSLQGTVIVDRH
jgi:hypothetical protein